MERFKNVIRGIGPLKLHTYYICMYIIDSWKQAAMLDAFIIFSLLVSFDRAQYHIVVILLRLIQYSALTEWPESFQPYETLDNFFFLFFFSSFRSACVNEEQHASDSLSETRKRRMYQYREIDVCLRIDYFVISWLYYSLSSNFWIFSILPRAVNEIWVVERTCCSSTFCFFICIYKNRNLHKHQRRMFMP